MTSRTTSQPNRNKDIQTLMEEMKKLKGEFELFDCDNSKMVIALIDTELERLVSLQYSKSLNEAVAIAIETSEDHTVLGNIFTAKDKVNQDKSFEGVDASSKSLANLPIERAVLEIQEKELANFKDLVRTLRERSQKCVVKANEQTEIFTQGILQRKQALGLDEVVFARQWLINGFKTNETIKEALLDEFSAETIDRMPVENIRYYLMLIIRFDSDSKENDDGEESIIQLMRKAEAVVEQKAKQKAEMKEKLSKKIQSMSKLNDEKLDEMLALIVAEGPTGADSEYTSSKTQKLKDLLELLKIEGVRDSCSLKSLNRIEKRLNSIEEIERLYEQITQRLEVNELIEENNANITIVSAYDARIKEYDKGHISCHGPEHKLLDKDATKEQIEQVEEVQLELQELLSRQLADLKKVEAVINFELLNTLRQNLSECSDILDRYEIVVQGVADDIVRKDMSDDTRARNSAIQNECMTKLAECPQFNVTGSDFDDLVKKERSKFLLEILDDVVNDGAAKSLDEVVEPLLKQERTRQANLTSAIDEVREKLANYNRDEVEGKQKINHELNAYDNNKKAIEIPDREGVPKVEQLMMLRVRNDLAEKALSSAKEIADGSLRISSFISALQQVVDFCSYYVQKVLGNIKEGAYRSRATMFKEVSAVAKVKPEDTSAPESTSIAPGA
jgi:hypothetical protein